MRVLLTGISSFTGSHFARALLHAGFEIAATQTKPIEARHDPLIDWRLDGLRDRVTWLPPGSLGTLAERGDLASLGRLDLVCLHGAMTAGHHRTDFDWQAALQNNISGLDAIIAALSKLGCHRYLLTDSIFQATSVRPAVSAYGLAKTLTSEVWRFAVHSAGGHLNRFVIPHPYGPGEKPGLTSYAIQAWLSGEAACLRQPGLVRDFVPVTGLAKAYADFAHTVLVQEAARELAATGEVMSNSEFIGRLSGQFAALLSQPCRYHEARQMQASAEPKYLNIDNGLECVLVTQDEPAFWPAYADFHECAKRLSIYS